ncbi:hypothetical protein [Celeribacter sp.]|uniref:hypothetical protein n=1 Tax=Celeribacter sp. TaxID=1890673 RepID=UPI003A8E31F1
MSLDSEERSRIIEAAMRVKFGAYYDWKRPELYHQYGANNLDFVLSFEEKLASLLDVVRVAFKAMSDDDLSKIQIEISNPRENSQKEWLQLERDRIALLLRAKPAPIQFGFGHPELAADFAYWSAMPKLSLYEVTALSLGADPRNVSEKYFEIRMRAARERKSLWAADERLLEQREIFSRYFNHTGLGYVPAPIAQVKKWIDEMQIPVHPEFYRALENRVVPKTRVKAEDDRSKPLIGQEREILLKLIAAMACEQYGYVPDAKRSGVSRNIKDDMDRVGLSMDEKTIRKWLKTAAELVDFDYWEDKD